MALMDKIVAVLPKKFCFCISLENGGFVLGLISIVGCFFLEYMLSIPPTHSSQDAPIIFQMNFINLIYLTVSILLLVGSKTGHSLLILPWLFLVLWHVIGIFVNIIYIINEKDIDSNDRCFGYGLAGIMVVLIYFSLCMFSLYLTLRKRKREAKEIIATDILQEKIDVKV